MAVSEISGKYAEVGQFTKALETAGTIESADEKAIAVSKILGKYAVAGHRLSGDDTVNLRGIVQTTMPMEKLWR